MKHHLVLSILMLCLAGAKVLGQSQSSSSAGDNSSREEDSLVAVPESVLNAEISLLGARTVRLADLLSKSTGGDDKLKLIGQKEAQGEGKVVVLNLFATWCVPCRLQSPELMKLYKEFRDRGVEIIELSTEEPAVTAEGVREWVWNYQLPYKVGWASTEVASALMRERNPIPQSFVITRDGRIQARFIGYSPNTIGLMKEAIEKALARR